MISAGALIKRKEGRFPWFLMATLLPVLVMPFSSINGNLIQRSLLPIAFNLLVVQCLRIMPTQHGPVLGFRAPKTTTSQGELQLLAPEWLYRALACGSAVLAWIPFVAGQHTHQEWHGWILGVICSFFGLTAVRIVQLLAQLEGVNLRSLCLGAAGYVHLGLTAGQISTFIQVIAPSSFSVGSMLPGEELIERLTYYSFITLGSIGYGDVIPKTPHAEFFAVCLSITGTLYMSLMIGLLLSRYINDQSQLIEDEAKSNKKLKR